MTRVAPLLEQQGLAIAWGSGWRVPAPHATAVDACWKLIPAFHGRWSTLWDLRTLEESLPSRFGESQAITALQARSTACHASRLHRSNRSRTDSPAQRVHALRVQGWLDLKGPLELNGKARDALMLFRLAIGARMALPPGSLDRIGGLEPRRLRP